MKGIWEYVEMENNGVYILEDPSAANLLCDTSASWRSQSTLNIQTEIESAKCVKNKQM